MAKNRENSGKINSFGRAVEKAVSVSKGKPSSDKDEEKRFKAIGEKDQYHQSVRIGAKVQNPVTERVKLREPKDERIKGVETKKSGTKTTTAIPDNSVMESVVGNEQNGAGKFSEQSDPKWSHATWKSSDYDPKWSHAIWRPTDPTPDMSDMMVRASDYDPEVWEAMMSGEFKRTPTLFGKDESENDIASMMVNGDTAADTEKEGEVGYTPASGQHAPKPEAKTESAETPVTAPAETANKMQFNKPSTPAWYKYGQTQNASTPIAAYDKWTRANAYQVDAKQFFEQGTVNALPPVEKAAYYLTQAEDAYTAAQNSPEYLAIIEQRDTAERNQSQQLADEYQAQADAILAPYWEKVLEQRRALGEAEHAKEADDLLALDVEANGYMREYIDARKALEDAKEALEDQTRSYNAAREAALSPIIAEAQPSDGLTREQVIEIVIRNFDENSILKDQYDFSYYEDAVKEAEAALEKVGGKLTAEQKNALDTKTYEQVERAVALKAKTEAEAKAKENAPTNSNAPYEWADEHEGDAQKLLGFWAESNGVNAYDEATNLGYDPYALVSEADTELIELMTEEELNALNYYCAFGSEDEAVGYYNALTTELRWRSMNNAEIEDADYASRHPVISAIREWSLPTQIARSGEFIGQALGTIGGKSETELRYGSRNTLRYKKAIGTISNDILVKNRSTFSFMGKEYTWGELYSFAFQTGGSMVESAQRMFLGGAGLAIGGMNAGASSYMEAIDRGAKPWQALAISAAACAAEIITEKAELDELFNHRTAGNLLESIAEALKQATTEGMEEVASSIINNFAEWLIQGDETSLMESAVALQQEIFKSTGKEITIEEAMWRAMWSGYLSDYLGGAASGLGFGAIEQAFSVNSKGGYKAINEARANYAIAPEQSAAFIGDLVNAGYSTEVTNMARDFVAQWSEDPADIILTRMGRDKAEQFARLMELVDARTKAQATMSIADAETTADTDIEAAKEEYTTQHGMDVDNAEIQAMLAGARDVFEASPDVRAEVEAEVEANVQNIVEETRTTVKDGLNKILEAAHAQANQNVLKTTQDAKLAIDRSNNLRKISEQFQVLTNSANEAIRAGDTAKHSEIIGKMRNILADYKSASDIIEQDKIAERVKSENSRNVADAEIGDIVESVAQEIDTTVENASKAIDSAFEAADNTVKQAEENNDGEIFVLDNERGRNGENDQVGNRDGYIQQGEFGQSDGEYGRARYGEPQEGVRAHETQESDKRTVVRAIKEYDDTRRSSLKDYAASVKEKTGIEYDVREVSPYEANRTYNKASNKLQNLLGGSGVSLFAYNGDRQDGSPFGFCDKRKKLSFVEYTGKWTDFFHYGHERAHQMENLIGDILNTQGIDDIVANYLAKRGDPDSDESREEFACDVAGAFAINYVFDNPAYNGAVIDALGITSDQYAALMTAVDESLQAAPMDVDGEAKENTFRSRLTGFADSRTSMEHDKELFKEDLKPLVDSGVMSEEELKELFRAIDKAIDIIKSESDLLDFDVGVKKEDRAFEPYKQNSDPHYKMALDFSTLCRKRVLLQAITSRLQSKLKRSLTAEEQVAIRAELKKMQAEGYKLEVACALCYVEAARYKSNKRINKFLDNIGEELRHYFALKNPEFQAQVKAQQNAFKESNGYTTTTTLKSGKEKKSYLGKKDMSTADANTLNELSKEWRKNYVPTAEEQAIIERALSMDKAEFLSPESLARMARTDSKIFEAFTSTIRAATRSKSQEADVAYWRGDVESVSDSLIAEMNEESGFRHQSWSDFQVKHLLDTISAVIELSTRGAKMHAYTKVADLIKLCGETGMMINASLIPAGDTGLSGGNLIFDDVEGFKFGRPGIDNDLSNPDADTSSMLYLRELYHETVGNIAIGINDAQIRMMLDSDLIDYVIPYHISGLNKGMRKAMNIPQWIDYTRTQNEKSEKGSGNAPRLNEWFHIEEAKLAEDGIKYMQEASKEYLRLCNERGITPKFAQFLKKTADGYELADDAMNYWKLLIDRKMVDQTNNKIIEQKAVLPKFSEAAVADILNREIADPSNKDEQRVIDEIEARFRRGDIKLGKENQRELEEYYAKMYGGISKAADGETHRFANSLTTIDGQSVDRGLNIGADAVSGRNYAQEIVDGEKTIETRTSKGAIPKSLFHKWMAIVDTSRQNYDDPMIIGYAKFGEPIDLMSNFGDYRGQTLIGEGDEYDIKPKDKAKWGYPVEAVKKIYPIPTPDGTRYNNRNRFFNNVQEEMVNGANNFANSTTNITPEQDADYMRAAESGDTETAQRIVDEVAKSKGLYRAYHGTNANFTRFDPNKLGSKNFLAKSARKAFFASASIETAESYTGLNSSDAMSAMAFNEESRKNMEDLKSKYDFQKYYDETQSHKKDFEIQYMKDHGFDYDKNISDRNDIYEKAKSILHLDEEMANNIADNIFNDMVYRWNSAKTENGSNNVSEMERAFEQSDYAKELIELNDKIYNEWKELEIKRRGYNPHIMNLYVQIDNPYVVDFNRLGRVIDNNAVTFSELIDEAKTNGNDGCIFKNVRDGGDYDTIYCVFKNTQFKSADPITYDNSGNIIPLSERFSTESDDIRFSTTSVEKSQQKVGGINKKISSLILGEMDGVKVDRKSASYAKAMEYADMIAKGLAQGDFDVLDVDGEYIKGLVDSLADAAVVEFDTRDKNDFIADSGIGETIRNARISAMRRVRGTGLYENGFGMTIAELKKQYPALHFVAQAPSVEKGIISLDELYTNVKKSMNMVGQDNGNIVEDMLMGDYINSENESWDGAAEILNAIYQDYFSRVAKGKKHDIRNGRSALEDKLEARIDEDFYRYASQKIADYVIENYTDDLANIAEGQQAREEIPTYKIGGESDNESVGTEVGTEIAPSVTDDSDLVKDDDDLFPEMVDAKSLSGSDLYDAMVDAAKTPDEKQQAKDGNAKTKADSRFNSRREAIRQAEFLFNNEKTIADYYAACREKQESGEHAPYDKRVARHLRGMMLRNGQNVGGMLSTDTMDELNATVLRNQQIAQNRLSFMSPYRVFDTVYAPNKNDTIEHIKENRRITQGIKDHTVEFGLQQNAARGIWGSQASELIGNLFEGKGMADAIATQLFGENLVDEVQVRQSLYGGGYYMTNMLDGCVLCGKEGKILAICDSEGTQIVDRYLKKKLAKLIPDVDAALKTEGRTLSERRFTERALAHLRDGVPIKLSDKMTIDFDGENAVCYIGDQKIAEIKHGKQPDFDGVENATKEMRGWYNQAWTDQNKVLTENGYEPMGYVKNYFPHPRSGQVTENSLQDTLRGILEENSLPTAINGMTSEFSPGHPWASHLLADHGVVKQFNAVTSFNKYVNAAGMVLFNTPVVQRMRQFESYTRSATDLYANANKEQPELANINSGLVAWMHELANHWANKKSDLDRSSERILGRAYYTISDTLTRWMGQSAVAGSVSSALSNFVSELTAIPELNTKLLLKNSVKVIPQLLEFMANGDDADGLTDKIPFLAARHKSYEALEMRAGKRALNKYVKIASAFFSASEFYTSELVARTKYQELLAKGMSEEDAIKATDEFCIKNFADRSTGMTPMIYNMKTIKPVMQFSLEALNQMSHFGDMHGRTLDRMVEKYDAAVEKFISENGIEPDLEKIEKSLQTQSKWTDARKIIVYSALLSMWGAFTRAVLRRDQTWNPYGMASDFVKDYREGGLEQAASGLKDTALEQTPIIGSLVGGGRIPISTIYDSASDFTEALKEGIKNGLDPSFLETAAIMFSNAIPTGGQIRKTVQGISTVAKGGSYSKKGRLRYPVEQTFGNYVKGALFGKGALQPSGYDYTKGMLSEEGTERYESAVSQGIGRTEAYEAIKGYHGSTNAEKALSLAAGVSDMSPEDQNIMAQVVKMSSNYFKSGKSLPEWGSEETVKYLTKKRGEVAEEEYNEEYYDLFETYFELLGLDTSVLPKY